MKIFKFIAPIGRSVGLLPEFAIFTTDELEKVIFSAGFSIEHQWQPGKKQAIFIVAQKPG